MDEPQRDRWGGQTTEDRIVSSLSRLEELLRARDGQDVETHGKVGA